MNELKELLVKAFNLELDDSQDAKPNTYLFNWEYDVTDALDTAVQLIETYTAKKELEARIDELNQFYDYWNNRKDIRNIDTYKNDRITQLSSQLTNNKEGIENGLAINDK